MLSIGFLVPGVWAACGETQLTGRRGVAAVECRSGRFDRQGGRSGRCRSLLRLHDELHDTCCGGTWWAYLEGGHRLRDTR
jgi:hypothetical protein